MPGKIPLWRWLGIGAVWAAGLWPVGAGAVAPKLVSRTYAEIALYPERVAQAQVVARNSSRVAAEVSGRIVELSLDAGQTVERGAIIARIDCREHELAAERARAALEVAKARAHLAQQQAARARELAEQNFIAREMLDARSAEAQTAAAEHDAARVALESAEHVRSRCVLRAPFPAIVAQRLGNVGEYAIPGMPLYVLLDRSRIEVRAEISPLDAAELKSARSEVRFIGELGEAQVRLVRLSPAIDPATRQIEARLHFTGPPQPPGSAGRVVWRAATPHLPAHVLVRRGDRLGVYVLENNAPRFLPLPEASEGRPAAAKLPLSTRIVVQGQQTLR